jgi:membrane peptidoglycan carboxypeptidase
MCEDEPFRLNFQASDKRKTAMKKFLKIAVIAIMIAVAGFLGTGYAIYYSISHSPNKPSMADVLRSMNLMSQIRFADGSTICEDGSERRIATTLDRVAPVAKDAFLSVEDDTFYKHNGVNYKAVVRAGVVYIKRHGKKGGKQGASTITQQVIRNRLLTLEQTLKRKATEAVYAIEFEEYLSKELGSKKAAKDKILETYLNWINFGSGRYGIESASQDFFGKSASQLNLVESAALAAIPKSPSKYNPRSKEGVIANAERRVHVLDRMLINKKISQEQYDQAVNAKLVLAPKRAPLVAVFSQEICDAGKARLRTKVCPGLNKDSDRDRLACELKVSALGTTVDTTIDARVQAFAHRSLEQGRAAVGKRHPKNGAPYASAVVIRNKTGEVISVASTPYQAGGLNYAYALRSVGSTMKPFVYGAGFDMGGIISPETVFVDAESHLDKRHPEKVWPSNYEPEFMGAVNVRTALAHSVNTIAVQAIIMIDAENVIKFVRKFGVTSALANERSLALGVSDISPFELANAYATFAREGEYVEPILFSKVDGEVAKRISRRAMSRTAALEVLDCMGAVNTEGTGRAVKNKLPVVSYGKTGTTSGHSDAWFALVTKDYTVVVWVGHKTRMSLGGKETGASAALPIALDIMRFLYTGQAAGAVYSMSTKEIDDSNVVEGMEFIEKEEVVQIGPVNPQQTLPEFEAPDDIEKPDTEKAAPGKPSKSVKSRSYDEFVPSDESEFSGDSEQ